jgi:hypothetical protein
MRALLYLRTSIIAFATILATMVVPACGSLCAAMAHCSRGDVSANSDSCHHADALALSGDFATSSLSSQASCGRQTPPVAILTASESSIQLDSFRTANAPLSIDVPAHAATLNIHLHDFLPSTESPQRNIPLEKLSVLRV